MKYSDQQNIIADVVFEKLPILINQLLLTLAEDCNKESGLNIQTIFDEPKCFGSMMAHYRKFSGVKNYIVLVGKKDADLNEKAGYYGEELACIIALGYGATQGTAHQNKPIDQLCNCASRIPEWFAKGMEAALLAPTAMNQQKFYFTLENGTVSARAGKGFYSKIDLGIVKYHFEAAAGQKVK